MEHEFGPSKCAFECRRVEDITANELCSGARECGTGPDIDCSYCLASADKGPHDIGSEVPRCPCDNEFHASTPWKIRDLRQWYALPRKGLQRTRKVKY